MTRCQEGEVFSCIDPLYFAWLWFAVMVVVVVDVDVDVDDDVDVVVALFCLAFFSCGL